MTTTDTTPIHDFDIQEACDLAFAEAVAEDGLIARCVFVGDLTDEELANLPDWVSDEPATVCLFLDDNGLIVWEEFPDEDADA